MVTRSIMKILQLPTTTPYRSYYQKKSFLQWKLLYKTTSIREPRTNYVNTIVVEKSFNIVVK